MTDQFQIGWNLAGKGEELPKNASEDMANGYWSYIEQHEALDDGEVYAS